MSNPTIYYEVRTDWLPVKRLYCTWTEAEAQRFIDEEDHGLCIIVYFEDFPHYEHEHKIGFTQDEMLAEEQERRDLFGCEQHRQRGEL